MSPTPDNPTYADYLGLEAVLTAATPRTDHEAERHFIATHQSMELGFQVIIASLRRVCALVDSDRTAEAVRPMQRAVAVMRAVLVEMDALHNTLSAEEFHTFREALGTASGFQSSQWRELELLAGLSNDTTYLRRLRAIHGGTLPPTLERAARERSLRDAYARLHPSQTPGPGQLVADQIAHFDALLMRWRYDHLVMVQQKLGNHAVGTGGKTSAYLTATLAPAVPEAWSRRPSATTPPPSPSPAAHAASPSPPSHGIDGSAAPPSTAPSPTTPSPDSPGRRKDQHLPGYSYRADVGLDGPRAVHREPGSGS